LYYTFTPTAKSYGKLFSKSAANIYVTLMDNGVVRGVRPKGNDVRCVIEVGEKMVSFV